MTFLEYKQKNKRGNEFSSVLHAILGISTCRENFQLYSQQIEIYLLNCNFHFYAINNTLIYDRVVTVHAAEKFSH